jgi:predicted CXXCH cytochrome family protein
LARTRTTKSIAERIDLGYWRRPHPFRVWKFRLSVLAASAATVVVVAHLPEQRRIFWSAGPLTPVHAHVETDCRACHVSGRSETADGACASCHAGTVHSENQAQAPRCAACHREHLGTPLAAVPDAHCTGCHASLPTHATKPPAVNATVTSFPDGHPEFEPLSSRHDSGGLSLNHGVHMWNGLRGPDGPEPLTCASCHEPDATATRMLPIRYEKHCSRCHTLELELEKGRPALVLPHGGQDELDALLAEYGADGSSADVAARLASARASAEKLCARCHGEAGGRDPEIVENWLPRAAYAHRPHRSLACTSCHAAALSSSATADVLLPGKAVCARCHHPGEPALSACVTCHRYHRPEKDPLAPGTRMPPHP